MVADARSREAPLGVEAVLDSALPQPLSPTWQRRWGSATGGLMGLVFFFIVIAARRRRRQSR